MEQIIDCLLDEMSETQKLVKVSQEAVGVFQEWTPFKIRQRLR
jgi:hypothetical protein